LGRLGDPVDEEQVAIVRVEVAPEDLQLAAWELIIDRFDESAGEVQQLQSS
jgi:hypothetical protein